MSQVLPSHASIVIVGGGAVGCSILYHLAKAGITDAVLLERHQIASGTTFHSAALVPPLGPTKAETELAKYSVALYGALEAETGQSTGWRRCGHLNLAASEERLVALKHYISTLHALGVEGEMIGPSEVKAKWPLLNVDDVLAAIWMPDSGRADPNDICRAFLKGAEQRGACYFEEVPVEDFIVRGGRVHGVRTAQGDIACEAVVNCTGLWGREVGKRAGVSIPLFACEHFYLLTDAIEGIHADLPAVRDGDAHLYMREDVGGMLVGCFEPNPKPLPVEKIPPGGFVLLDEDWDHFGPMLEGAIKRIPALATAGSRQLVNGPESFTMDHSPLLGEAPEVRGFFVACGMNSFGVTMAGGVGWAMAEWITKGAPPIDLSQLDIRRFQPAQNNIRALSRRIPEVLAHHHTIPWPGHNYATVRNVRRSPFFGLMREEGAFFAERGGWERPVWFAGRNEAAVPDATFGRPHWFGKWAEEHAAAKESVGIFDATPLCKILIQGRDAPAFLKRLCNVPPDMLVGTARAVLFLNERGGIESDPTISRIEPDGFFLTTASEQGWRDRDFLMRHLLADEHVTITDVSSAYATLFVAGPRSRELLESLSPERFDDDSFSEGTVRDVELGYGRVRMLRTAFLTELGFELHIASDTALCVLEALLYEGSVTPRLCGSAALQSLRLERGLRFWGADFGPGDTPEEVGLSGKWTAGILRRRRLVSFTLADGDVFPHGAEALYRNGELAGFSTSATFSHALHTGIILGWIEKGDTDDGSVLSDAFELEVADKRHRLVPQLAAVQDSSGVAA